MNKKIKTILSIIITIVIIGGFWWVASSGEQKLEEKGPIKIGMAIELTGFGAFSGENVRDGAELAVKEINTKGGIDGRLLKLIYEDSETTALGAVNAANKLINIDQVPIIISGFTDETKAISPIAENNDVVLISASAGGLEIGSLSPNTFRTWPADKVEASNIAKFAVTELGAKTAAIVYTQGSWEDGLRIPFRTTFEAEGGKIIFEDGQNDPTDWRNILLKLKSQKDFPDVIYMAVHSGAIAHVLNQIDELGIDSQPLYTSYSEDPALLEGAGKSADGLIYPKYTDSAKYFITKYEAEYDSKPGTSADIAYDTIYILSEVIKKYGAEPKDIINGLQTVKNYAGTSGEISFDKNGDRVDREVIVKIIQDGKYKLYSASK